MAAHDFLPKDVREGLDAARRATERKRSRLKVRIGDEHYTVLRRWTGGFSLAVEDLDPFLHGPTMAQPRGPQKPRGRPVDGGVSGR